MSLATRAVARILRLPPALTDRITTHKARAVRMRDGVILRTDHYAPALPDCPTVLIRTPYGRGGPLRLAARAMAERGFHVVVQSCRGTFDSGGVFEPMRRERDDGLDTLDWLRCQPWHTGPVGMFGPSYVGFVQWAVAADAGADLKALAVSVTASQFRDSTYAGGGFSLDTVLTWSNIVTAQGGPRLAGLVELLRGQPRLKAGLAHPTLSEADTVAVGAPVAFYQEWLVESAPDAPYWAERGHAPRIAEVEAPVLSIGGWYDIFLPWQLADYAALRAAGRSPHLVVGPWHHGSPALVRAAARGAVDWFRAHLRGEPGLVPDRPVRLHVGGADEWRDFDEWPPPARTREWFLEAGGGLGPDRPDEGEVGRFRYDPADPTPAVGGPRLIGNIAGQRDNRQLEARPDVLTFTGAVLSAPVEVIGPVRALVRMRSTLPYGDVFVRLCDVHPDGRSVNVCDGLTRVDDGRGDVTVDLWPTAYRFGVGHRIRVQVSGGAHPRFARNPGTGAPLGAAGPLKASWRTVLAGSVIELPETG